MNNKIEIYKLHGDHVIQVMRSDVTDADLDAALAKPLPREFLIHAPTQTIDRIVERLACWHDVLPQRTLGLAIDEKTVRLRRKPYSANGLRAELDDAMHDGRPSCIVLAYARLTACGLVTEISFGAIAELMPLALPQLRREIDEWIDAAITLPTRMQESRDAGQRAEMALHVAEYQRDAAALWRLYRGQIADLVQQLEAIPKN
jgi:hypothetical protein